VTDAQIADMLREHCDHGKGGSVQVRVWGEGYCRVESNCGVFCGSGCGGCWGGGWDGC